MRTKKSITHFRKHLALIVAFVFLFTTIASPAFAVEELASENETVASEELVEETPQAEEEAEESLDETTDDTEVLSDNQGDERIETIAAEVSEAINDSESETIEAEYVEGEALVCYLPDNELFECEKELCNDVCELLDKNEADSFNAAKALLDDSDKIIEIENKEVEDINVNDRVFSLEAERTNEANVVISLIRSDEYSTEEIIEMVSVLPNVDYVEPNYIYHKDEIDSTTDRTSQQYAYNTTYGLHVPNWNNSTKKNAEGVVVAVIDTGVEYTHPDLAGVMWDQGTTVVNKETGKKLSAETGCGMYGIDTSYGSSTITGGSDPMDVDGHGSHCAGIIGAQWNSFGVSGAANGVKIMAIRAGDSESFYGSDLIQGMNFVIKAKTKCGVNVVCDSNSWGSSSPTTSSSYVDTIKAMGDAGIVTCFSAGNAGKNIDETYDSSKHYDKWFFKDLDCEITVGNSNKSGERSSSSNYGKEAVDVFAPGSSIYSTYLSTKQSIGYASLSGTSMACPAVSGEVAILRAQYPNATVQEIVDAVIENVTPATNTNIKNYCVSGGYANVEAALDALDESSYDYTVKYNANGGSGSISSQRANSGDEITIKSNNFTKSTSPKVFVSWNTKSDGSGTWYKPGQKINAGSGTLTLYAIWGYSVTFNTNGGTINSGSFNSYYRGQEITLPTDVTKSDYDFAGWYKESNFKNKVTKISASDSGDKTFYAKWTERQSYSITYTGGTGTSGSVSGSSEYSGATITLKNNGFSKDGYTFAGWKVSGITGTLQPGDTFTMPAQAVTITAQWTANPATINCLIDGENKKTITGTTGSTINDRSFPTASKSGYTLDGWYENNSYTGTKLSQLPSTFPAGTKTYYARFVLNTYTVSYNKGDATNMSTVSSQTKTEGQALTLRTKPTTLSKNNTTKSGTALKVTVNGNNGTPSTTELTSATTITTSYTAAGWATSSGGAKVYDFGGSYTTNAATTLYPAWNTSDTTSHAAVTLPSATQMTRSGYTLLGYSTSDSATGATYQPGASYTPSANITLYAVWSAKSYTLAYDLAGGTLGSNTNPSSYTIETTTFTLKNPTRTGYTFAGWKLDGETTAKTTVTINKGTTGNKKYTATWTANKYTVTFNPNGGTCSITSKEFTYGGSYGTLPTPTKTNSTFAGWFTSASGGTQISDNATVNITENTTAFAHWADKAVYTVSFETNGGSTVASQRVVDGEKASRPSPDPTKAGYAFAGWFTKNGTSTGDWGSEFNFSTTSITSARTIYAKWTPLADDFDADDVIISGDSFVFDGRAINPKFTITDSTGRQLVEGRDYTVVYKNCDKPGTGSIVITFSEAYGGKTITKTFTIVCEHKNLEHHNAVNPTCTANGNNEYWHCKDCSCYVDKDVQKISTNSWVRNKLGHSYASVYAGNNCYYNRCTRCGATTNYRMNKSYLKKLKVSKGKKCFTVKWKKQSKKNRKKFTGYQIRYSRYKNMSGAKYTTAKNSKSSKKIKKLAKKTKYYVQVRTYYKGYYYSSWGSIKTVKTK